MDVLDAVRGGIRPNRYVAPAAPAAESGQVRRDDEDDRSGDGGRAGGDASWVDRVVIPDDISALEAEVRALHRERRAQRRRDRLRRLVSSGRTAPMMMIAVLLVAGLAGLLVLFQPRRTTGTADPVDTGVAATDRRLPDVLVRLVDGTTRRVREFRPAVLALAPVGCGCDAALREAGTASQRHGVDFLLVDRTLPPLPRGLTEPATVRLAEPTGAIPVAFGAEADGRRVPGGPVLVVVGAGGNVVRVLPEASPQALERELAGIAPLSSPTG